jgi:hypothetical protein
MSDFPFVVGVTGHRDLAPSGISGTRDAVKSVLEELVRQLGEVKLQIVCGMAEGADQLVAGVALELGLPVHAVLPMPLAMYRDDFSGEALAAFDQLLDEPEVTVHEIPLPPDLDQGMASAQGPDRDRLYTRLGEFLGRRSNLLLALWDGKVNGLAGGTGDVLLRYLGASPPDAPFDGDLEMVQGKPEDAAESNLAVWVRVDRGSDNELLAGEVSYLAGEIGLGRLLSYATIPAPIQERLAALDLHLVEHRELAETGKLGPGWSLFGGVEREALPDELVERLQRIDDAYLRVDGLALHNQQRSDRVFAIFGLMAGTMGLLFLLYAKIAALKVFLLGYLVLFAGGYFAFKFAGKRHWFTRHLVYRVTAESLRVHFFMALSGIDDRSDFSRLLDLTGIRRFPGFGWVADALRIATPLATDPRAHDEERLKLVQSCWIDDQAAYFKRKIHQLHEEHHRLEKIKHGLFILSFVGVIGLVLFKKLLVGTSVIEGLDFKTLLVFLMGLLPLWLGIWEIYQNKMAVRELLWQYRNQADLFASTASRLQSSRSEIESRHVLLDLADRSLFEVYLWAIHRFHREHEPPAAG